MSLLLCVIMILAVLHYFYQNVIQPYVSLKYRIKLVDLEERLQELKSKHTISPKVFSVLKVLLRATEDLVTSEYGVDLFLLLQNRKEEVLTKDKINSSAIEYESLRKNKNQEVQKIVNEHFDILLKTAKSNLSVWVIYIVPLLLYAQLRKLLRRSNGVYFKNLSVSILSYGYQGMNYC